ncbi:hypothetical protein HPB52_018767 [Rhipicephalus sanguineus]|uniref:Tick transposon n=1 Tax=Rhipicephalus sanguineus TaxID=34632 RepID=A0A9D4PNF6_RHISA|nr:hypothetical protein HPB52_018767 [Rhipicephalus sanguineus]
MLIGMLARFVTFLSEPSRSGPNGDRVAATQSNIGSAEAPQGPVSTPRYRSVALPTLQVPTYAGDLRQWQEFWDHYSATIHENTELPPIEKFKYLLTYLTGAAKRAIEGIRLADNNYEIAVTTLKERFGRHELLVNEHIDQLLALSPVRSSKEVEKLRVLHDTVRFRVSALEGLGVPPEQYTVVLHRVLMRCLPEDLAIMYRQKKKEESTRGTNASAEPTPPEARTHKATDILAFLKIQVEVREEGKQEAASSYTHNSCHQSLPEPYVQQVPTPTPNGPLRAVTSRHHDRCSCTNSTERLVRLYLTDGNYGVNWRYRSQSQASFLKRTHCAGPPPGGDVESQTFRVVLAAAPHTKLVSDESVAALEPQIA